MGPDGAIYAGGLGADGNWGQEGKLRYGLQKLSPNGRNTFDIQAGYTGFHHDSIQRGYGTLGAAIIIN